MNWRRIFAALLAGAMTVFSLPQGIGVHSANTEDVLRFYRQTAVLISDEDVLTGTAIESEEYYTRRLIVQGNTALDLDGYGADTVLEGPDDLYVMQFPTVETTELALHALSALDEVRYAELDQYLLASADTVQEASAPYSWGTSAIEADLYAAWAAEHTSGSVTVAVIDTGVAKHSYLNDRLRTDGYDLVDGDTDPNDPHYHGTHVAGIVADCTPGLDVRILPVRVLNKDGVGGVLTISNGIRYAADQGADVINLSLGGVGECHAMDEAIDYAISQGAVVVTSAGNYANDTALYHPAQNPRCIVVSAVNQKNLKAAFSNYGATVDLAAPGVAINSTFPGGTFRECSGTSMAAPHIAAAAAMLRLTRPDASPAEIEALLTDCCEDLGDPGRDVYYGAGLPKLSRLIPEVPTESPTDPPTESPTEPPTQAPTQEQYDPNVTGYFADCVQQYVEGDTNYYLYQIPVEDLPYLRRIAIRLEVSRGGTDYDGGFGYVAMPTDDAESPFAFRDFSFTTGSFTKIITLTGEYTTVDAGGNIIDVTGNITGDYLLVVDAGRTRGDTYYGVPQTDDMQVEFVSYTLFYEYPEPTEPPTDPPTEAPTQPPTEAPTQAPTQPPTEAQGSTQYWSESGFFKDCEVEDVREDVHMLMYTIPVQDITKLRRIVINMEVDTAGTPYDGGFGYVGFGTDSLETSFGFREFSYSGGNFAKSVLFDGQYISPGETDLQETQGSPAGNYVFVYDIGRTSGEEQLYGLPSQNDIQVHFISYTLYYEAEEESPGDSEDPGEEAPVRTETYYVTGTFEDLFTIGNYGYVLPVEDPTHLKSITIHTRASSQSNSLWGGSVSQVGFTYGTEERMAYKDFYWMLGDCYATVSFDGEYYTRASDGTYETVSEPVTGGSLYILSPDIPGGAFDTEDITGEFLDYALVYTREVQIQEQAHFTLGDVNEDGTVNANDATAVLMAAARIGAKRDPGLTETQLLAANVDRNNDAVNANDAAFILRYAAYRGAKGVKDIYEYFGYEAV